MTTHTITHSTRLQWFDECNHLADVSEADRDEVLKQLLASAQTLIASGQLDKLVAVGALLDASKRNGLVMSEGQRFVREAFLQALDFKA